MAHMELYANILPGLQLPLLIEVKMTLETVPNKQFSILFFFPLRQRFVILCSISFKLTQVPLEYFPEENVTWIMIKWLALI